MKTNLHAPPSGKQRTDRRGNKKSRTHTLYNFITTRTSMSYHRKVKGVCKCLVTLCFLTFLEIQYKSILKRFSSFTSVNQFIANQTYNRQRSLEFVNKTKLGTLNPQGQPKKFSPSESRSDQTEQPLLNHESPSLNRSPQSTSLEDHDTVNKRRLLRVNEHCRYQKAGQDIWLKMDKL